MAKILEGKAVVQSLNQQMAKDTLELNAKGITPTLAILRVGERPDDLAYERGAIKRCEGVGVAIKKIVLPEDVDQATVLEAIDAINVDDQIHGCLIFRPLPSQIDDTVICDALDPKKDVDGITDGSLAGVFAGKALGYPPCTAQACIEILDYYGYDLTGKTAVVIGRSLVIGKPVSMMLLKRNSTVTICHTKTRNMQSIAKQADFIIAAAGKAGVVTADFVSSDQVVIDVGINFSEDGKMKGDVDYESVEPIVGAITPVPGGVGTVTTSVMVGNVIKAAKRM